MRWRVFIVLSIDIRHPNVGGEEGDLLIGALMIGGSRNIGRTL